jgi:hypothetical protein
MDAGTGFIIFCSFSFLDKGGKNKPFIFHSFIVKCKDEKQTVFRGTTLLQHPAVKRPGAALAGEGSSPLSFTLITRPGLVTVISLRSTGLLRSDF